MSNSDLISMDKDTVWVIRVKEVREEKTAPFADVQEEVRLAYLRSEAAKLADKKAKEAIEALKAGKAVDLKWSEVSKLSAQDARRTMAPEAYNELIKAPSVMLTAFSIPTHPMKVRGSQERPTEVEPRPKARSVDRKSVV